MTVYRSIHSLLTTLPNQTSQGLFTFTNLLLLQTALLIWSPIFLLIHCGLVLQLQTPFSHTSHIKHATDRMFLFYFQTLGSVPNSTGFFLATASFLILHFYIEITFLPIFMGIMMLSKTILHFALPDMDDFFDHSMTCKKFFLCWSHCFTYLKEIYPIPSCLSSIHHNNVLLS